MLESSLLQLIVFPFGVLYLALHAGPLFRLWYEPSIRGGTRWQFFASEVALFTAWIFGSPVLWHSTIGRWVIAAHLGIVEGTVKIHITSIFNKLGVNDRTQALIEAVKRGIVQID